MSPARWTTNERACSACQWKMLKGLKPLLFLWCLCERVVGAYLAGESAQVCRGKDGCADGEEKSGPGFGGAYPTETLLWSFPVWQTADPVYANVKLPSLLTPVLDHPIFQKLREVKQLGYADKVFPSATHTRFAHSLGVAHLARAVLERVDQQLQQPDSVARGPVHREFVAKHVYSDKDRICVLIAALCHDIGHPAFSHAFEEFMHENGKEFSHEVASNKLLTVLWQDVRGELESLYNQFRRKIKNGARFPAMQFTELDLVYIQELIELPGKKKLRASLLEGRIWEDWPRYVRGRAITHAWTYEIVSNWRGGLDVDRLDYFVRDPKSLGLEGCPVEYQRYVDSLRLVALPAAGQLPGWGCPSSSASSSCSASEEQEAYAPDLAAPATQPREQQQQEDETALELPSWLPDLPGSGEESALFEETQEQHARLFQEDSQSTQFILSLATPDKDICALRYSIFQWRMQVYPRTYRHPDVAKYEKCLLRAMRMLTVPSASGARTCPLPAGAVASTSPADASSWLFEAAKLDADFDYEKYLKLTDGRVQTLIQDHPRAGAYFDYAITRREKVLDIGGLDLSPRRSARCATGGGSEPADVKQVHASEIAKLREFVLRRVLERDWSRVPRFAMPEGEPEPDALDYTGTAKFENFMVVYDEFHQGNKDRDPLECTVFYDSKSASPPWFPGSAAGGAADAAGVVSPGYIERQVRFLFDPPKRCGACEKRFLMEPVAAVPAGTACTCDQPRRVRAALSPQGLKILRRRLAATVYEFIKEKTDWECAGKNARLSTGSSLLLKARGAYGLRSEDAEAALKVPLRSAVRHKTTTEDGAARKRRQEGIRAEPPSRVNDDTGTVKRPRNHKVDVNTQRN
ncbi:unnamed protein product [Amoebophrya sp. A120]|nr:unnamed protein product [Amoebophrya sp. A120]|eukprot:GSA120T00017509001.1